MNHFKVGEIAILQNCIYDPSYNGEECTVLGRFTGLGYHLKTGAIEYMKNEYLVETVRGDKVAVRHYQLRKKQPPKREIDQVVSWENCAWSPVKEAA